MVWDAVLLRVLGEGKLGAGSRVFEEKSEVEEQVPWLRNMVISGRAGYDRQLVPSKTFHCSGGPGSFNKRRVMLSIHRSISSHAVIYLKTFSKRGHQ